VQSDTRTARRNRTPSWCSTSFSDSFRTLSMPISVDVTAKSCAARDATPRHAGVSPRCTTQQWRRSDAVSGQRRTSLFFQS
jgi:hypothetical protein